MNSDIDARSDPLKGFFYALAGSVLVSTNWVTAKYGLRGFNPETFSLGWTSAAAVDTDLDELSFEGKRGILQALGLRVRVKEDRSYRCFGTLPAISEFFATLGSWGKLTNPIPLEFEGVI